MRQGAPLLAVVEVLGGTRALGNGPVRSYRDFDRLIRIGLPVKAFRHAITALGQSQSTLASGIGIARSTLERRKVSGRLGSVESERVIRLGRIAALGKLALGSTAAAGRWLVKPNRALGGETPLHLLQTDVGAREVEAVLGRSLFGGYS